ncbi:MAG TPA: hypothetical protein VKA88_00395 [Solirubrobacterales bacterium]|nr:hypothetical protein [Solirubrobacterales bacterium]
MEAATARTAPATRPAPRRRPRRAPSPAARPRLAAGAALLPQAAVRSVGAVRDISDSSLIMRLTRGRGWIAVLCALLGGIVALNVLSLSLSSGSGRTSLQIDDLKTQVSALQAQIDERLAASRVEDEASRLGLAVPDPKAITYLSASDGDAQRLARLLSTDSFLTAPSQPSSYPTAGSSYAPTSVSETPTTTTAPATSTTPTPSTTPSSGAGTTGSGTANGTTSGASSGSSGSSTSSGGATGGVGL